MCRVHTDTHANPRWNSDSVTDSRWNTDAYTYADSRWDTCNVHGEL